MNVLSGLTIVFTGTMTIVRSEIERDAKLLGAWVEPRVTKRTDWLVTGKRVGKIKLEKASADGCRIITESEYRQEIETRRLEGNESGAEEQQRDPPMPRKEFTNPDWIEKIATRSSVRF